MSPTCSILCRCHVVQLQRWNKMLSFNVTYRWALCRMIRMETGEWNGSMMSNWGKLQWQQGDQADGYLLLKCLGEDEAWGKWKLPVTHRLVCLPLAARMPYQHAVHLALHLKTKTKGIWVFVQQHALERERKQEARSDEGETTKA